MKPLQSAYIVLSSMVILCSLLRAGERAPESDGSRTSMMQQVREFDDWRRSTDIGDQRGWKYYKRWEHDELMHLDASANRVTAETYLAALTSALRLRENQSSDFGAPWKEFGPQNRPTSRISTMQNGLGRASCLAFHPTDTNTYYVGIAQGGVWKTTDDGTTWRAMTDRLPILRISDIAIDPQQPNTLYIAVGDYAYLQFGLLQYGNKRNTYTGLGVYKSTDGGEHWSPTGLAFSQTNGEASLICKILVHPRISNVVVAVGVNGMYYSTDGGTNWSQRLFLPAWDLVADPGNSSVLYATTGYLSRAKVGYAALWRSSDFGWTWKELPTRIPARDTVERIKFAVSPSDPRYMYAITTNLQNGLYGLYRSTNEGASWTKRFDSLNLLEWKFGTAKGGQGTYDLVLAVHATNPSIIYAGGVNLWTSADGGASFHPSTYWTSQHGASIHADLHVMYYRSLTRHYYICNDGGVVRTREIRSTPWSEITGGKTFDTKWEDVTKNMSITSFYRVSSSRSNNTRVIAGAQDNSTAYFDGTQWNGVIGGDGMDNWLDPDDDRQFIGSSQYGYFVKTTDGLTYKQLSITKEAGEWTTPLVADYTKKGTFYTAYGNVFVSSDVGETWTKISSFSPDSSSKYLAEASALAVAQGSSVIMVCRRPRFERGIPSRCMRSEDRGATWRDVTQGLPDSLYLSSIEIAPDDTDIAWVSCSGMSAEQKVYKTTDGGRTWFNISFNLPNLPISVVKVHEKSDQHLLFVGTDVGVYCTDDRHGWWFDVSTGLPNVIVTDLEINYTTSRLYASTFGRGLWQTDLITEIPFVNSVDAVVVDEECRVYPSPLQPNQDLRIEFPLPECTPIIIKLYSSTGELVVSTSTLHSTSTVLRLPSSLQCGMYLLRVEHNGALRTKSFIVQ